MAASTHSDRSGKPLRVAVIGHVEHVTVGRVAAIPTSGQIAHLEDPCFCPGGGGGIAFSQLAKSPAEVHLFTAIGTGEAGALVAAELARSGASIHVARRADGHTRDLVMIAPDGERTIVVIGQPLHPQASDPLPWQVVAECDAAYFTAQDPDALRTARAARVLVVTARRRAALDRSGVRADVVVGSAFDPREASTLADYRVPPAALVLTEGSRGGRIETEESTLRFAAPAQALRVGAYGAGDSFAGALTFYLAAHLPLPSACARAALHGAAVLRGFHPLSQQLPLSLP
ncbi:MAG TPA: PfkB family carbohydrate kinase [Anaeromyxobacteraceae bacterium]|nr:PfkB family carbohydrate kinase [Anaeromyxobacteraceae bacterium]